MKFSHYILLSLVQLLSAVKFTYNGQIMKLDNGNNILAES